MSNALIKRYRARDALITDSGTTALRLAIQCSVGETERPVALPGYTCYDVATAAEGAGAKVVLYDVDPATLGPDLRSLELTRIRGPGAVVVGHLFGHIADVRSVRSALPEAILIEDAAQGIGGSLGGRPLGSLGSVSVLSFGRGKGWTGGGGGALLALDAVGATIVEQARRLMPLSDAERGAIAVAGLAAQLIIGRPCLYALPARLPFLHLGETVYHPPRAVRPASVASLAVVQRTLELADGELAVRVRHARRLLRSLESSTHLRAIASVEDGVPGCLRLPAIVVGAEASSVVGSAALRLGIAQGYPATLSTLPTLAPHLVHGDPELPGATELARRLITLPTHGLLGESDLVAIERWIADDPRMSASATRHSHARTNSWYNRGV